MAAMTADAYCSTVGNITTLQFKANADTFYQGAICYADSAGEVQPTYASGDVAIGISPIQQVAAQDTEVKLIVAGAVWLPVGTSIAAADEGDWLCNDGPADTDNPADMESAGDLTLAAGDMIIGKIMRVTASQMLIWLDPNMMGCVYFTNGTPANYSGWGKELA